MKKLSVRLIGSLIIVTIALFAGGCSMDGLTILEHPDNAEPSDTIEVALADYFIYISDTSIIREDVVRESLFVAAGLPDGWSIVSMDFYPADHYHVLRVVSDHEDTLAMIQAMQDSMEAFESRKEAMTEDNSFAAYLSDREFTANDTTGNFTMNTDSVDNWYTYTASIDLQLNGGDPVDTALDGSDLGMDTIGYVMVPVYVYAKIIAQNTDALCSLYYYAKTGNAPSDDDTLDAGGFTYKQIQIGEVGVLPLITRTMQQQQIRVFPNPFSRTTSIRFTPDAGGKSSLSIYNIQGRLVRSFNRNELDKPVSWNGRDTHGRLVSPGTYIVRLNAGGQTRAATVQLVR